jgi:hypothetical protein
MFKTGFVAPLAGTAVTLELRCPASAFYGNADESAVMLQLQVMPQAPWENDHV